MRSSVIHECYPFKVNEKTITSDIVVYGVYESDYGSDADGNRGISCWFIDDYEFVVPDMDDEGHKLSDEERETLKRLVQDFTENHDWNFEEELSRDMDYQDDSGWDDRDFE